MGKPEEKQSPGERKEQGETTRWLPGADSSGTRRQKQVSRQGRALGTGTWQPSGHRTEYRECGLRGTRRAPSSEEKTEKCKQPSRGSGKSPGVLSELRGRCCERELTGHTQPDTSTAQRRSCHLVGESVFPSYCLPERVPHLCVLFCGQAQTWDFASRICPGMANPWLHSAIPSSFAGFMNFFFLKRFSSKSSLAVL